MPAKSEKQRRFMGAELARLRSGKKSKTGMTEGQLKDYATKGKGKLPKGVGKAKVYGSGKFSEQELKQGYKKGQPVNIEKMKNDDLYGRNAPDQVKGASY